MNLQDNTNTLLKVDFQSVLISEILILIVLIKIFIKGHLNFLFFFN